MVRTMIMEGGFGGAIASIVTRPICIVLIIMSAFFLVLPIYNARKEAKAKRAAN